MINCSKCGFEMDPIWRFCPKCGSGSVISDAELIRELQVGVAGHFERALKDELQKRGYLEPST